MEISKELLNIVLEKELEKKYDGSYTFICNGIINLENNEASSTLGFYDSEIDFFINVYELAHKCKEWANNQSSKNLGYAIKTVHYGNNVVGGFVGIEDSFIDDCKTEYELVFKLCQWILDNKS